MAIAIASNDVKWSQWKPPTVTEYPLAATKSNYQLFVQLPWKVGLAFKNKPSRCIVNFSINVVVVKQFENARRFVTKFMANIRFFWWQYTWFSNMENDSAALHRLIRFKLIQLHRKLWFKNVYWLVLLWTSSIMDYILLFLSRLFDLVGSQIFLWCHCP